MEEENNMNHEDMDHSRMNHGEHDHSSPVEDEEIVSWKKKLIWAWIFALPAMIIMLITRIIGIDIVSMEFTISLFLILGFPVVFITGWETLRGGFRGLFTFYFNMDSLIALGTVIAYLTGIFALFKY